MRRRVNAAGRDLNLNFNPASVINTAADTFNINAHGLENGDDFIYVADPAGSAIGGLIDGQRYKVAVESPSSFKVTSGEHIHLDPSEADPNSTQSFSRVNALDFEPANPGVVDIESNRIRIAGHGLSDGQRITYLADDDSGVIGGLIHDNAYLVANADADSFELVNALTEQPVDLTDPVAEDGELTAPELSGEHYFLYEESAKHFQPVADVAPLRNTITLLSHGYETGDSIVYRVDPNLSTTQTVPHTPDALNPSLTQSTVVMGDTPVDGLDDSETYYVVVVDANTIRLASSAEEAELALPIDLTSPGSGSQHTVDLGKPGGISLDASLDARNFARTTSGIGDPGILDMALNAEVGGAALLGQLGLSNFAAGCQFVDRNRNRITNRPSFFTRCIVLLVNQFLFQAREETFAHRIVPAVPLATHAAANLMTR